jgi:basic membrane lipoprotein Med (substrate-binding protein (PBP1-ABC) superfamily)
MRPPACSPARRGSRLSPPHRPGHQCSRFRCPLWSEYRIFRSPAPQTADNAQGFVNSLTGSQCKVIIAVGDPQVAAASTVAGTNPQVRFITINGGTAAANVQVINAASTGDLQNAIKAELGELAEAAS